VKRKMTMVYWKGDKYWLGKLLEHPEIMTQGETLEELEENIKDAYLLIATDENAGSRRDSEWSRTASTKSKILNTKQYQNSNVPIIKEVLSICLFDDLNLFRI